jgi:hypothetical protein
LQGHVGYWLGRLGGKPEREADRQVVYAAIKLSASILECGRNGRGLLDATILFPASSELADKKTERVEDAE